MTETEQWLREYCKDGSERAFRELVTRYVDLVYSVALRNVGGGCASGGRCGSDGFY